MNHSGHSALSRVASAALLAGAMLFSASLAAPVQAAVPSQKQAQVPGYYRMMLGQFEVTALYDGYLMIENPVLIKTDAADIQSLFARMFISSENGVQTAVNAFLVHTGSHLVLVDVGTAGKFGPTLGHIANNLRAAGYDPAQVDTVLLTHLHPDHACGLLTDDGKAVFPNATVHVSKTEADYWLDEAIAAKAPKELQGMFQMSREAVAPYRAANKLKTYQIGDTLVPGIEAVLTPGHTPGHVSYLLNSLDESMLVWGDIIHSHAVQFAHPEVAVTFDSDAGQAVATRQKILAQAAADRLWIAGAHLPFPGIGHVATEGKAYAWVPIEYAPVEPAR
ncbi:MBL fold metallo-hydrolase [Termitidicoccus mucosus]|uniref:MBL fold metallo-hydrolase n=1 Tax=Termitidicoccus mucosus TaxID=1184151 RepID=A0A178IF10_9BACT|nr:MBL fold metallo-hydrolase [Opitutaceae bacterium TSB47]